MVEALAEFAKQGMVAILLSLVLYFVAATAHERSHWVVGRLWSDDVTIIHDTEDGCRRGELEQPDRQQDRDRQSIYDDTQKAERLSGGASQPSRFN